MIILDRREDKMRITGKYEPKSLILSIITLVTLLNEVKPNKANYKVMMRKGKDERMTYKSE